MDDLAHYGVFPCPGCKKLMMLVVVNNASTTNFHTCGAAYVVEHKGTEDDKSSGD